MLRKYITENDRLIEIDEYRPGCWVELTDPQKKEYEEVAQQYNIDISDIGAAMDDEESSRIDAGDDYTMMLFDIPTLETRHELQAYTTMPLGIIINDDVIITICSVETPILQQFANNTMKDFSTKKQRRFSYQILLKTTMAYQSYLRIIDKKRKDMEDQISKSTKDLDIISLHNLESNLVYFDTSLHANRLVIDKISRYSRIKKYAEDQELLEDVIIENQQAIEMTKIYRDIISGTRELMASIMDNRLNTVMKYLAAITIVMAIPTIISGLYGMNVNLNGMPFSESRHGFGIICIVTVLICVITWLMLKRRKML